MKILQSTIERSLYILLLVLFLTNVIVGLLAWQADTRLAQQQKFFHDTNVSNQQIIKENQQAETTGVKTYIACLLTLSNQSATSLQQQEQVCFDKAPPILK